MTQWNPLDKEIMQLCKLPKNDQPVTSTQEIKKDYAEDVHIRKTICSYFSLCISTRHHIHVYIYFMMLWLRFLPMMIRTLKEEAMKVCLSVAGIVQNSQRMKLTMHNALIIGFPGG